MSTTPENDESAAAEAPHAARNARLLRWLVRAASLTALKREATATAKNAGTRVALKVVAGVLWLLVAGFLMAAFVIWLSGIVGAIIACAIVAAAFAVIALVLHLIAARMARRRHTWNLKTQFPGLAEAIGNGTLDDSALGALAVAALAGFFVGLRGKR
jgi:Flp pilus assembly protein TadB